MQSTQPVPTTPTEPAPPKPDLTQLPVYQATPPQTADTRAMIPDEVAQVPTYQAPPPQAPAPQPVPYQPAPYQPTPYQPTQYPTTPPPQGQSWSETRYDDRTQRRIERRNRSQAAGIEVWGVLLILVGAIALVGNFGIGLGWMFGLALGAWFVYLGVRHVQAGQPVNWWLVGLGLLIGLGAISTGFLDQLIFPSVLVIVGLGILAEYVLNRQKHSQ
jgi:hypothetical protein